jgi:hypothetical protein
LNWLLPRLIDQILQRLSDFGVALSCFRGRHFHRNRQEFLIVSTDVTLQQSEHLARICHE